MLNFKDALVKFKKMVGIPRSESEAEWFYVIGQLHAEENRLSKLMEDK